MRAVIDANGLIGLAKGGVFEVLDTLCTSVHTPTVVFEEVVLTGAGRPGADETEAASYTWLRVEPSPIIKHAVIRTLKKEADRAVVALADNLQTDFIISDDKTVRRMARSLGLDVLATVDVLVLAKQAGAIQSCRDAMDTMEAAGFGIEATAYQRTLLRAGEVTKP